jgi:tetratricopeptide (TPR) repeat protein
MALLQLSRFKEANDAFSRAIEFKPDFVECYPPKALALQQMERFDEAIQLYESFLKL